MKHSCSSTRPTLLSSLFLGKYYISSRSRDLAEHQQTLNTTFKSPLTKSPPPETSFFKIFISFHSAQKTILTKIASCPQYLCLLSSKSPYCFHVFIICLSYISFRTWVPWRLELCGLFSSQCLAHCKCSENISGKKKKDQDKPRNWLDFT